MADAEYDDDLGNGRFTLNQLLGSGGMGMVYAATDNERGGRVALKLLDSPAPDAFLRFRREFQALQDLHHPNLVSLGELFEDDGRWFYTMELIEGVELLDYIRDPDSGTADDGRLRSSLAQVCRALLALHAAGLVHRDIKPSNILVRDDGHVTLLDLGLVSDRSDEPGWTEGDIVGTVAYMAPEQARGQTVGPAADWYAVGSMLYEALVGRPPFTGSSLRVLVDKQGEPPRRPRHLAPDVSEDLEALCMELLSFDPDDRPSGPAILHRLDPSEPAPPIAAQLASIAEGMTFVGRERELEIMDELFAATRSGSTAALYVRGESGIGKTALVRRFVERVRTRFDALALVGRCFERESLRYKALDGVVEGLARHMQAMPQKDAAFLVPRGLDVLVDVFPVLRKVHVIARALDRARPRVPDPQESRSRMFTALRELLSRLATTAPVIIMIDDLQWTDSDSIALLSEIMRPPHLSGLLLIGTLRTGEAQPPPRLDELPCETRTIELARFTADEGRELATELLRREGIAVGHSEGIAAEAQGHPLFIGELVRAAALVGRDRGRGQLDEVLWQRISELTPPAREVLETIAVAGAPMRQDHATDAIGLPGDELARLMADLRVRRLLRTSGFRLTDHVDTYHDRIRQAVLHKLDHESRIDRHRTIAHALEAAGDADPASLSAHFAAAGELHKAADYATDAARAAMRALAFAHAERHYRLAIELFDSLGEDSAPLRPALADALASAGRGSEAAAIYLAAADGASTADAIDLHRRAAQQLLVTGHIDEGIEQLREVLASEGMSVPETPRRALLSVIASRLRLKLRGMRFTERDTTEIAASTLARLDICWHAGVGLAMTDRIKGLAFQSRGLLMALRAGEPRRLARSIAVEAAFVAAGGPGKERQVNALLARGEALAERTGDPHAAGLLHCSRGTFQLFVGRFRAALESCRKADEIFRERCAGVHWELATTSLWTARALHFLGEFAELSDWLPAVLQECRDRGDLYGATSLRVSVMPFVTLAADEPERADEEVALAVQRWSVQGFHVQHYYALFAHASIRLYAGDPAGAELALAQQWPALESSMLMRVGIIRAIIHDVRARAAVAQAATERGAERAESLERAEKYIRLIEREKMDWSDGLAHVIAAGVAHLRNDTDAAARLLTDASEAFERSEMRIHATAARGRLGLLAGNSEPAAVAEKVMREQRIANPERTTALLVPGF